MEQIEKYNKEVMAFGIEYKDVLSKTIFANTVQGEVGRAKFFNLLERLNYFELHVPYSTDILKKYEDSVICSYRDEPNRFLTTVFQKSLFSYFSLNLRLYEKGSVVSKYLTVDIYSNNSVKDWIEFSEENKGYEDYSLAKDDRKVGLTV